MQEIPRSQRETGCTSFLNIPASEAACTRADFEHHRSLALGSKVKAALGEQGMSQAGGNWPVFLEEVPLAPVEFPDLPLCGSQPCPRFLKLSPFSRTEQRQDGYFYLFLRGGPALSLPFFPAHKTGEKGLKKIRW